MMPVYKFVRPYWIIPEGLTFSDVKFTFPLIVVSVIVLSIVLSCSSNDYQVESVASVESPGIVRHANTQDLKDGKIPLEELLDIGEQIFRASLNTLDGAGNSKTRLLPNQDNISKINAR